MTKTLLLLFLSLFVAACSRRSAAPALSVIHQDDELRLLIDGRIRGAADTLDWKPRTRYASVLSLPANFVAAPGNALVIGVSNGSVAREYTRRGWHVEAVEPDSAVANVARELFHLQPEEATIHLADGRKFLEANAKEYDVIVVDAIAARELPSELMTTEFFQLASGRLGARGIFGIAFESAGWHDPLVGSVAATMKVVFPDVKVLPTAEPPNKVGSIVVLGLKTPTDDILIDVPRNLNLDPDWRFGSEYEMTHAWDNHFIPDTKGGRVQQDGDQNYDNLYRNVAAEILKLGNEYMP